MTLLRQKRLQVLFLSFQFRFRFLFRLRFRIPDSGFSIRPSEIVYFTCFTLRWRCFRRNYRRKNYKLTFVLKYFGWIAVLHQSKVLGCIPVTWPKNGQVDKRGMGCSAELRNIYDAVVQTRTFDWLKLSDSAGKYMHFKTNICTPFQSIIYFKTLSLLLLLSSHYSGVDL